MRARAETSPARRLAFDALTEAERRGVFAERLLHDRFRHVAAGRSDRALATFLVQETLRRRGELDFRLGALLDRPLDALPGPVREALRLGLVQLLFCERIPARAAVHESVELVKAAGFRGLAPLVNAVLRRAARGEIPALPTGDDDRALAARASLPVWLVNRWRRHGDALAGILEGSNRRPDLVLRVDRSRASVEDVLAELRARGVEARVGSLAPECIHVRGRLDLESFPPFTRGVVSAQDESEALVSRLVDPEPSSLVLDLCAAPGGKCLHLLERTGGRCRVVALDRSARRLRLLAESLRRVGRSASLACGDGKEPPFRGPFDRVLVDAPCTGTGVLARRADARWRLRPEAPADASRVQHALLVAAGRLVRSGGILAYSVCSIEPEETDELVDGFLRVSPEFREEPVADLPAAACSARGRLWLLPGAHEGDGVFGVRLRRIPCAR